MLSRWRPASSGQWQPSKSARRGETGRSAADWPALQAVRIRRIRIWCLWDDVPPPGDADAPEPDDSGPSDADGRADSWLHTELDDDEADWAPPTWPLLPAVLPTGTGSPAETGRPANAGLSADSGPPAGTGPPADTGKPGAPPAGLLDLLIPWRALLGADDVPAMLGRIGPITIGQATEVVDLAIRSPGTQWRVIVTDDEGRALAVERARRRTDTIPSPPGRTGIVGRVTVTMPASAVGDALSGAKLGGARLASAGNADAHGPDAHGPGTRAARPRLNARDATLAAIARAARRAAQRAQDEAQAFAAAGGSCEHGGASAAYRPPPRIREHVTARDVTCRFRTCGQPAWRADLDHTIAYDQGGPTCTCNLGGGCRTHHKIKALPGWDLEQTSPGYFTWTTPAGRSYTVNPDRYPI